MADREEVGSSRMDGRGRVSHNVIMQGHQSAGKMEGCDGGMFRED